MTHSKYNRNGPNVSKTHRYTFRLNDERAIGVNFNQVTRSVHTNFNVRRAIALLSRLEGYSAELCELERQVIELTEGFRKWSEE